MPDRSQNTVLGLKVESVAGTFSAPNTTTDLITVADLRPSIQGITSEVNEFTGTIHKPGPKVGGATMEISGRCLLRGPGGSSPPAADAFVLGRILRAVGFTETVVSAAVPAAAEALGGSGNTTTIANLGASAIGTDDLYILFAISLASLGTIDTKASLALIRDYVGASKLATIMQTAGGAYSGNYHIPKQLAYRLASAEPPTLSASCWIGSKRYDGRGLSVSSFRINAPTFSRESTDLPNAEFTLTGDFYQDADESCPTIDTSIAPPPFKDGKMLISNTALGGASIGIDFNAALAYAPDPNQVTGNLAAALTETTRRVNFTLNHIAKASFDFIAKADAQLYHSIMASYGLASGNHIMIGVPNARFNFPSPDNGGPLATLTGEMFVDDAANSVGITFPFYT